jgi:hypothetical protein
MAPIVRTWPALCALGAGLVHLAVASSSAPWLAVILIAIGLAELAWAIVSLSWGRPAAPRMFLAVTVAPVLGVGIWAGASAATRHMGMAMGSGTTTGTTAVTPLALACLLNLMVALACASAIRGRRSAQEEPGVARAIVGLLLGAALVAGVTIPALGATDAGEHATMHMQM